MDVRQFESMVLKGWNQPSSGEYASVGRSRKIGTIHMLTEGVRIWDCYLTSAKADTASTWTNENTVDRVVTN